MPLGLCVLCRGCFAGRTAPSIPGALVPGHGSGGAAHRVGLLGLDCLRLLTSGCKYNKRRRSENRAKRPFPPQNMRSSDSERAGTSGVFAARLGQCWCGVVGVPVLAANTAASVCLGAL